MQKPIDAHMPITPTAGSATSKSPSHGLAQPGSPTAISAAVDRAVASARTSSAR